MICHQKEKKEWFVTKKEKKEWFVTKKEKKEIICHQKEKEINPSKMEVAPQGCLHEINQKANNQINWVRIDIMG